MNNLLLMTFGTWESTELRNNGTEEIGASCLVVHIACDTPGRSRGSGWTGIGVGQMDAWLSPTDDPNTPQNEEEQAYAIFPGRFEADINIPDGTDLDGKPQYRRNVVIVENDHPNMDMDYTRVTWNDDDITDSLLEFYLVIDSREGGEVRSFLRIAKNALIGFDKELHVNII